MTTLLVVDIPLFRVQCAAYSNATTYPDLLITNTWGMGSAYVSTSNYGNLKDGQRQYALNLMCAHLLYLSDMIAKGSPIGVVTSASEGAVSIGLMPPPTKNQFQYWLNQSPYGTQLLALLRVKGAVGVYVGGNGVTGNFRNPNGTFTNG